MISVYLLIAKNIDLLKNNNYRSIVPCIDLFIATRVDLLISKADPLIAASVYLLIMTKDLLIAINKCRSTYRTSVDLLKGQV